jgi:hypothetical protein
MLCEVAITAFGGGNSGHKSKNQKILDNDQPSDRKLTVLE